MNLTTMRLEEGMVVEDVVLHLMMLYPDFVHPKMSSYVKVTANRYACCQTSMRGTLYFYQCRVRVVDVLPSSNEKFGSLTKRTTA